MKEAAGRERPKLGQADSLGKLRCRRDLQQVPQAARIVDAVDGKNLIQANADEWLRRIDGVRLRRADRGWDVLTAGGDHAGIVAEPDAARRLADFGHFERAGVLPVYEFPDHAACRPWSICIRHLHGLEAIWFKSVPVHEKHEGQTVSEGEVQVFAVAHPKGSRVYAWSTRRRAGRRGFMPCWGWSR